MHRTPTRILLGATLMALLVPAIPWVRAQDPPKPSALIVAINGTVRLQMTSKKAIKQLVNPKEAVINIRTVAGDPTTVLITGQQPDVTTIELTDVDDRKESYEVIVQLDIDYLKTQLRRTVPTANITPIPTSNNSVILTGTVSRAEDVNIVLQVANSIGGINVINAMRVGGVQQVQLDVVVAAVSRNTNRSMGFDFLISAQNFFIGSFVAQTVTLPASTGVGGQFSAFPALIGAPAGNSNVLFGILHNGWGFLGYLQALRLEGMARILTQPSLVTLSGRPASFLVGGEQAIPVPAGLGQVGVQFEEFGTRLNFLPIVLGNGKIHLEVEPEISNLNAAFGVVISGATVPGRDTNRINTTVQLEPGQTFVIGGLVRQISNANSRKTPILGDLPFFGAFFSQKVASMIEEEVVVLVTPHLVDPQDRSQVAKVLPGQETRPPDDFELFLEGILEAPRGPRRVIRNRHYVPAFKGSPSMEVFPGVGNELTEPQVVGAGVPPAPPVPPGLAPGANPGPAPGPMPEGFPGGMSSAGPPPAPLTTQPFSGQPISGQPFSGQAISSQPFSGQPLPRLPNGPAAPQPGPLPGTGM